MILGDRFMIKINKNQKFELFDFATTDGKNFFHVKKNTGGTSMNHLVAQAKISTLMLLERPEEVKKLFGESYKGQKDKEIKMLKCDNEATQADGMNKNTTPNLETVNLFIVSNNGNEPSMISKMSIDGLYRTLKSYRITLNVKVYDGKEKNIKEETPSK